MKWIYSSSKFKYDGKPVERRKAVCDTPLGELRVFESVGGKPMIQYISIGKERIDGKVVPTHINHPTEPCGTLEAGVLMLEIKWNELIKAILDV